MVLGIHRIPIIPKYNSEILFTIMLKKKLSTPIKTIHYSPLFNRMTIAEIIYESFFHSNSHEKSIKINAKNLLTAILSFNSFEIVK